MNRTEKEQQEFIYDGIEEESLGSDFFEKPKSGQSFAYSDVIPSPSLRSFMSEVSQDAIDARVLSPSTASVISVQSEGSSHLSEGTKFSSEKFYVGTDSVPGSPIERKLDYESDVSVRSPIASLNSLSVQSSFSLGCWMDQAEMARKSEEVDDLEVINLRTSTITLSP